VLLYLHIPFCDSKCFYCSFNSYTDLLHLKNEYMQALQSQLLYELERFQVEKNSIETIFIGGGTPSTVEPNLYEKFIDTLLPYLKKDVEFTTEANPNSATYEWIKAMKNLGVNRISFGVQSFDEKKLKYLGRNHSPKDAIKAIENAHKAGIKNISLDIIYDTVKDTKELLKNDLQIAFNLPINHISSYSLTIEKATKFYQEKTSPKDDENLAFWFVDEVKKRFPQYEISNFGNYRSKHNLGYWQLKDYIGIGSGAVGFLKNERFYPQTNVKKYLEDPTSHRVEKLSKQDLLTEKIFLGLRSEVGVETSLLPKDKVKLLLEEKKLYEKNSKIFNKNFFLADELALFLIED